MKNTKKILSALLKLVIFVLMIYFIYYQLEAKGINYKEAFSKDGIKHSDNYFLLIGAILLVFVNWSLESLKWKTLVNTILPKFSFLNAIKSILMGVCLGFVTPNRVGEFGGRIFNIKDGYKFKAVSLAFRGGMAQFIVTFSFGLVSALFVYKDKMFSSNIIYFLLLIVLIFLLIVFYRFNGVVKIVSSISLLKRFVNFDYVDLYVSNFKLTKVFAITVLRYLIYINQYILLCYFFSIEVDYPLLFSIVSTMILTQTIGFSLPLIDLPYRGGVLLFLLDKYTDNQLNILFVILLVWILNLVLPAMIGYLNIISVKLEVKNEKLNSNNNNSNESINT